MKLGLFLTPGAARTAYQVGAVQALMGEGGLHFDVIAASSVGALNGAFAATGQIDRLASLWATLQDRDIMGVDWSSLLKGAVLWAPNLMHNRPQRSELIDPYLSEDRLLSGLRFRFNLANLTTGDQEIFEWPGAPVPLADAVDASEAIPAAIRAPEFLGMQWADGLTVDGFPLDRLLLETGVDRVFVAGVAPRVADGRLCTNVYRTLLRTAEWNQFSETVVGLERTARVMALIRQWVTRMQEVEDLVTALVDDASLRQELLATVERCYAEAGFPYQRKAVEIVPILPEHTPEMFFVSFRPQRSRALMEQGRQDALRVLHQLDAQRPPNNPSS